VAEVFIAVGKLLRNWENGQNVVAVYLVPLHLLHNFKGILYNLRMLRKQGPHLLLGFEILLLSVSHTVGVIIIGIGGKAYQAVVRRTVFLACKVGIVCGYHLNAEALSHTENLCIGNLLQVCHLCGHPRYLCAVQLYLQVIILPKEVLIPEGCLFCLLKVAGIYEFWNLPSKTGRTADEVLVVLLQNLTVHFRLVIETLCPPCGNYLYQIVISCQILCQQNEVVCTLVFLTSLVETSVAVHIHLTTYYRLHIREILCHLKELLHTKHIAVVSNGQCRLVVLRRLLEMCLYAGLSIQD